MIDTTAFLAFSMPGNSEWVLIFVIVFLLFGAKKLPELARGIGKSLGEFRKAKEEFNKELTESEKIELDKKKETAIPTTVAKSDSEDDTTSKV